jgi:hypothetical protein
VLKRSIELWEQLAKSGANFKNDTFAYTKYNMISMYNECPLCDYYYKKYGSKKVRCIYGHCPLETCGEGSLYSDWCRESEDTEQRQCAARAIADTLKFALEEAKNE